MVVRASKSYAMIAKIRHGGYGRQLYYCSDSWVDDSDYYEKRKRPSFKTMSRENQEIMARNRAEKKAVEEQRKKEEERRNREKAEIKQLYKECKKILFWQTRYINRYLNAVPSWQCPFCRKWFRTEQECLIHLRDIEKVSLIAKVDNYYCILNQLGIISPGFLFSSKELEIMNIGDEDYCGLYFDKDLNQKGKFVLEPHTIYSIDFTDMIYKVSVLLKGKKNSFMLNYSPNPIPIPKENIFADREKEKEKESLYYSYG